ncbi:MAG: hypothetical protein A2Y81_08835 [Nitrospirae bacterium RBG_13_43_8]|nr:MAG: hypothetical protein A2Y81_08835 [Nitrospirae bacterium RBG_13_43_8]
MMRKFIVLLILIAFIPSFSAFAVSKNEPFKKISIGLKNITCGVIEIPDNSNKTNSKGEKAFTKCTDATKDDVGRGIVRVVGGLWEIATFWYPTD